MSEELDGIEVGMQRRSCMKEKAVKELRRGRAFLRCTVFSELNPERQLLIDN